MGNVRIPDIDLKQHLKAIYTHVDSLEKELDKKEKQIKDLTYDNFRLETILAGDGDSCSLRKKFESLQSVNTGVGCSAWHELSGMLLTLNILGIKIKGVNDR
ncbi:hypothetical protein GCM10008931_43600 [Oceanobacillus oncorhynchi subsp. oncorhynchi]|uniref:hypothetical protein n=1 Tax=Oceanobacillus oncorhynchi TaxID=545501 RepID=UPI0031E04600